MVFMMGTLRSATMERADAYVRRYHREWTYFNCIAMASRSSGFSRVSCARTCPVNLLTLSRPRPQTHRLIYPRQILTLLRPRHSSMAR